PAVSKEQQVKECLNTLALIGYDYKPGSLARVHQHFNQLKTFRDVKFTYLIVKSRYYFRLAQAYAHDAHLYANTSHPDWSLQRLTQAIEALKKIKGELMGPWPSRIASFLVMLLKKKFHNCWRESNHPQAREFLIEIREIEGKTEMPLVDYAQKLFNEFNSQS
ncbi:MAG TPA: hypothetical protein VLE89_03630, partial [Chlamydiales bacterium]|nr:hypothetical protein [Chlamydiales bacterium]